MAYDDVKKLVQDRTGQKIRVVDLTIGTSLDAEFFMMFLLYWIASQPVLGRSGKNAALELIQAGLVTKFKKENALIKRKLKTFCDSQGITIADLLEILSDVSGSAGGIEPEELEPEDTIQGMLLAE